MRGRETGVSARLFAHLRTPLHRNAYALVISGALSSALGLVYWAVAARSYTDIEVGVGAAAVSAMNLLANAAGLGLQNGLIRLVPTAGRRSRAFVGAALALSAVVAAVLAAGFLIGLRWWSPRLAPLLLDSPITWLAFIGSTVVWIVFVLQDSTLIGLRRATVIPVENLAFSIAKIVLVLALASSAANWGVFASWGGSALLAVVAVTGFVLPRYLREAAVSARADQLPPRPELFRYLGAEYVAFMSWVATANIIPLIVLHRLGAAANAHYYLAFQLAAALTLLPTAISASLTAEAATAPAQLQNYIRKGARNAAIVLLPAVVVVVLGASQGLRLFGPEYTEAAWLLRLAALGAVPYAATALMVSVARVQGRMRAIVVTYLWLSGLTFGLTLLLLDRFGLTGAGIGSLIAQTLVAVVSVVTQLHRVGVRGVDRYLVRLAEPARGWMRRRRGRSTVAAVEPLLGALGTIHSIEILATRNDVTVARLRTSTLGTQILKVSESAGAAGSITAAATAMDRIRSEVPVFAPLVPAVHAVYELDGRRCSVEEYRSGDTGLDRLADRSLSLRSLTSAIEAVGVLHTATARRIAVDDAWLQVTVHGPLDRVRSVVSSARSHEAVEAVRARLVQDLAGRRLTVSTIHGDLAPANLLFDLETRDVSGLLDWEASRVDALPEIDIFQLLFALSTATDGIELDEVTPRLLSPTAWSMRDTALLDVARASRPNLGEIGLWSGVALAWLGHVAGNLAKATWYGESRRWTERNVEGVLLQLARFDEGSARPLPSGVEPAAAWSSPPAASRAAANAPDALDVTPVQLPPVDAQERPTVDRGRATIVVEPAESRPSSAAPHRALRLLAAPAWTVPLGAALWILGVRGVDLSAMTGVGLLSVIRPIGYLGLAVLVGSMLANLSAVRPSGRRMAALLSTFIVLIHGTPAVLYAGLRYSWAWKHVGIVDFILRTDGVDPAVAQLAVYHQWPGFFSAAATLTRAVGADNALAIAAWAPVAFNLLNLVVLVFLTATLCEHRRVAWFAVVLFFTANWVGQDYFSPQALTYAMYLTVIALALQRFRRLPADAPGRAWNSRPVAFVIGLLVVAVATSHQLTPVMLTGSLFLLALTRQTRTFGLAAFSAAVNGIWAATFARPFVSAEIDGLIERFGSVASNAGGTISDASQQSDGQALVSMMGRFGLAAVGVLAVVGFVRRWRQGAREWTLATLIVVPASVLVMNDYGGEVVFRVVLFSMPFLAILTAYALIPQGDRHWGWVRGLSVIVVTGLVLTAFLFGYYGKERQYSFTADEVGATEYLQANSGARSLLVTINSNYPNLVVGYERFTTVPIVAEPTESRDRVVANPADVLGSWLADPAYDDTFLLVTRSQKVAGIDIGEFSAEELEAFERALDDSPRFTAVYSTPDASVYQLTSRIAPNPSIQEPA